MSKVFFKPLFGMTLLTLAGGCGSIVEQSSIKSIEPLVFQDKCLSSLMQKLEIDVNGRSSPAVFADILAKDMMLGDAKNVQELFATELEKSIEFRPILEQMAAGIVYRNQAVHDYVCGLVDKDLIPALTAQGKALVERTIHHTYLLNELTKKMSRDVVFSNEVINELLSKRETELGIKKGIWNTAVDSYNISKNLFTPAKMLAVDWSYYDMLKNVETGTVTAAYKTKVKSQLVINILEAVTTDAVKGLKDNALAGVALAINPPTDSYLNQEKNFLEFGQSKEWVDLYNTWNLAFITGNVPNLNILYPKLIMPEILNAEPTEFLYKRALSLWLTINFSLKARLNNGDNYLPNNHEMAKLWGEINAKHAKQYVQKTNGRELKGFGDLVKIPLHQSKDYIWSTFFKP